MSVDGLFLHEMDYVVAVRWSVGKASKRTMTV
jgi:hypothetical protein